MYFCKPSKGIPWPVDATVLDRSKQWNLLVDDERTMMSGSIYWCCVAKQNSVHDIETKELVCISKDSRFHSSPESSPRFITSPNNRRIHCK